MEGTRDEYVTIIWLLFGYNRTPHLNRIHLKDQPFCDCDGISLADQQQFYAALNTSNIEKTYTVLLVQVGYLSPLDTSYHHNTQEWGDTATFTFY